MSVAPRPVFLVAPDKFKGTLTAAQAAALIEQGLHAAVPNADIRTLPMADGGEGTVDAVIAAGGERRVTRVSGPLGDPVDAEWALLDGPEGPTAVIEAAAANGLALVSPTPRTALDATTFGVGELIVAALDAGAARIVIGLGGSATTDGGTGALRALGARPLDAAGADVAGGGGDLSRIGWLLLAGLDPRLARTPIVLASDVANPFAGASGAAHVFAAQKGADEETIELLDAGLRSFQAVLKNATGTDLETAGPDGGPWGGAAGGLGGGLRAVLGAQPRNGVDVVADLLGFDAALDGAALLVVGEGSIDEQTALGKAPVGLARRARARGIRTIAIAGRSALPPDGLVEEGIATIGSASEWAGSDGAAMTDPRRWVPLAAQQTVAGVRPRPVRSTVPTRPTPYFHFLRTPRNSWWRSLLYLVAAAALFLIVSTLLGGVAVIVDLATGRTRLDDYANAAVPFTPMLFLANNLGLASLVPISYLLQWAITRQRPRWLSSVAGRFRWRWLLISAGIVLAFWIVYLGTETLIGGGLGRIRLSPDWLFMLLAVVITTPLQAAGEEFGFRGALVRGIASWIPVRWAAWGVGTVVSSVVFMFAHLAEDPWLNLFYFSFGVAASVLAWRTGGLEAGIAIHAINNTLALLPVALFGDIDTVFQRGNGTGSAEQLIGIGVMIAAIVVLSLVAKRRRVERLGPPDAPAR